MTADRRFGHRDGSRKFGISWQRISAHGEETSQFPEQIFLPFRLIGRLEPAYRCLDQCLSPGPFEEFILRNRVATRKTVSLEHCFRFFSPSFVKRNKLASASAFERLLAFARGGEER